MPYIAVNTSLKLSDSQKEKIKSELGRLITIIPTKTEAGLYIEFSDSKTVYKAGANVSGVFIDLRLFKKSDYEPKKKFTEEIFEMFFREFGIKKENMCLNITEFENWGAGGSLK